MLFLRIGSLGSFRIGSFIVSDTKMLKTPPRKKLIRPAIGYTRRKESLPDERKKDGSTISRRSLPFLIYLADIHSGSFFPQHRELFHCEGSPVAFRPFIKILIDRPHGYPAAGMAG